MSDSTKTAEQIYKEKVGTASRELFEALYELAKRYVELEYTRKDRSGAVPPEQISDAAQKYRQAEREAQNKSDALVTLHCNMLTRQEVQ